MHRVKSLLIGAGLLFAAAPALAEGEGEGSGSGSATVEAGAGGAGGGAAGAATATVGDDVTMGAWPQAVIDRPYTLPASKLAVYGDVTVVKLTFTDPVSGMSSSTTGEGLALGAGYGINDKITAGVQYALSLHEFEAKGPLTIYGEFKLAHSAKMSVAASASFTIDLAADNAKQINAGLGLRYNLAPKVAIFTGAPFGPGPVGQHLGLSLESNGPIVLDIPVGILLQATPQLGVFVDTTVAHISISNSANAFFGADFIPLTVGGLLNISKDLDVVAQFILPDLKNAKFDLFAFAIGAAFYK